MEPNETQDAAAEILAMTHALYQPKHQYISAHWEDFRRLSASFYEKIRRLLEQEGFRWVADVEDLTVSQAPDGVRTVIRTMLSSDGTIQASAYHFKPKLFMRLLLWLAGGGGGKMVDFETEFSNGHFMTTSNSLAASAISLPAELHTEYLKAGTSPTALLARHKERLCSFQKENPSVTPKILRNRDDMEASQHRQEALKAAFRKALGGVSREEVQKLAGHHTKVADEIYDEIAKTNRQNP